MTGTRHRDSPAGLVPENRASRAEPLAQDSTERDAWPSKGSDVRLSEVSSAAACDGRDRRSRARRWTAFRADETGAGEYSPPTAAIVAHPVPDPHIGRPKSGGARCFSLKIPPSGRLLSRLTPVTVSFRANPDSS
ncbi:hypothetical protein ACTI_37060 [Actinoplanes sp. OR16]|nr:hypothetical protein ACTI_37060 [Actinoplanes sp. OR16]